MANFCSLKTRPTALFAKVHSLLEAFKSEWLLAGRVKRLGRADLGAAAPAEVYPRRVNYRRKNFLNDSHRCAVGSFQAPLPLRSTLFS
jgi:hypothetical protein